MNKFINDKIRVLLKSRQFLSLNMYIHSVGHCIIFFTSILNRGRGGSMSQVVGLHKNSYKPITNTPWVRARLCKLKKGAFDSQPQVIKLTSCLPMVGGSLGTLASSTTKTGRHDIAEILLKVTLKTKIQFKFNTKYTVTRAQVAQ